MIDSSDAELTFIARRGALEPCLRWRLTRDALLCERDPSPGSWLQGLSSIQWPERIPLREIASIRARFDPTRFASNRYRCDLLSRNGARISIFSTHYTGPGMFEDRGDQYAEFVSALVLRTQRIRPSVQVAGGLSWPSFLLQHGLLLASLVALVTMLGIAGVPLLGQTWVKLAIILTYAGVALRYARINFPKDLTLPLQQERDERAARLPHQQE